MDKCIFCKKQTSNEYSYFMANSANGARKKISVFACTKCLNKNSVIIPSIVTLFFVLSLLGNIDLMSSGKKDTEAGTLITISVIIVICLLWTIYKAYCIIADKPLSEISATKKLINKAKKVDSTKFYFTTAENRLTTSEEEQAVPSMECYKKFYYLIESRSTDQLQREISAVKDLQVINEVINFTYVGRLKGVSTDIQKIIKMLFEARAKEVINEITNVQFLYDINKTLNAEAKKDSYNVNQLESYICSRIESLKLETTNKSVTSIDRDLSPIVDAIKGGYW